MNASEVANAMPWEGVIVRFGEMGIKSAPVRNAMLERLRANLVDGIMRHGVEGDVQRRGARLGRGGPVAAAGWRGGGTCGLSRTCSGRGYCLKRSANGDSSRSISSRSACSLPATSRRARA